MLGLQKWARCDLCLWGVHSTLDWVVIQNVLSGRSEVHSSFARCLPLEWNLLGQLWGLPSLLWSGIQLLFAVWLFSDPFRWGRSALLPLLILVEHSVYSHWGFKVRIRSKMKEANLVSAPTYLSSVQPHSPALSSHHTIRSQLGEEQG